MQRAETRWQWAAAASVRSGLSWYLKVADVVCVAEVELN